MLDFMVEKVRLFRAGFEGKHEKYGVKKLLKSIEINKTFSRYYNFSLSQWHTQREFEIVSQYSVSEKKRMLFIGSGALPVSAIHFCRNFHLTVECIDVDSEAIELSQRLVEKLQINQYFQFHHINVLNFLNFQEFDFIIVAAMAGVRRAEKQSIIQHLANHIDRNIPVVFRTVFGIKQIWLPHVQQKDLNQFNTCHEYRKIYADFVDSIIITMN